MDNSADNETFCDTCISKNAYRDFREITTLDDTLKAEVGKKNFLASMNDVYSFRRTHMDKNFMEESSQPNAQLHPYKPVIRGGQVDILRAPAAILTENFEAVMQYMNQDAVPGWLVLEGVTFTADPNGAAARPPEPTNLDWNFGAMRDFLCSRSSLGADPVVKPVLCTAAGALYHTRLMIAAPKSYATLDYTTLLYVGDPNGSLWQAVVARLAVPTPRPVLGAAASDAQKLAAALVDVNKHEGRMVYDYKMMCDVDASHVAVRAHAQKGQASYASEFCLSLAWHSGVRKIHAFAAIVNCRPGDDKVSTWLDYDDSRGLRQKRRLALAS